MKRVPSWFHPTRDPEDRQIDETNRRARKDKMLDKTIADTFPARDPDEDSLAA